MHILDACVLVGPLNPRDVWPALAEPLLAAFLPAGITPVYFGCVAAGAVSAAARRLRDKGRGDEVWTLIARMPEHAPPESLARILPDVPALYDRVLDLMRGSSGELNFNDALVALACRERGTPVIACFDAAFEGVDRLTRIGGRRTCPPVVREPIVQVPAWFLLNASDHPAAGHSGALGLRQLAAGA